MPCRQQLRGDEEHVSGWDLIYDGGFIEIDPEQCGYTTFLGSAVPQALEQQLQQSKLQPLQTRDSDYDHHNTVKENNK